MKTILVPTDFSVSAFNAVKYAFAYAEKTKLKITLFHSYENPTKDLNVPFSGIYYSQHEAGQQAETKMKKLVTSMSKAFPGILSKWIVQPGIASDNIIEHVKQNKIALIIMGTTGQGAFTRALIGSTTSHVITNASCTIIAVPPKARFKGISKIAIATDLEKDGLQVVTEVVSFAKIHQAEITFVYVQDLLIFDAEETLHKMADKIRKQVRYKNTSFYVCSDSNIANGLDLFVKKKKPDILSMVTHRRKFPETLWKASWTKKIANHTLIPLLIFHIHQPNTAKKVTKKNAIPSILNN